MLGRYRVVAFPFAEGVDKEPAYWRDVGTIDAYWQAHMDLLGPQPRFRLDESQWPLHTTPGQAPPTIMLTSSDPCAAARWMANSVIAPGCVPLEGRIERSILAPGVCIEAGAEVSESVLLESVHIGPGARVRRAILDRGTRVPPGTCIGYESAADEKRFPVSEGGIAIVASTV
jgi:glucose-1-phosphate adenylyltransferase